MGNLKKSRYRYVIPLPKITYTPEYITAFMLHIAYRLSIARNGIQKGKRTDRKKMNAKDVLRGRGAQTPRPPYITLCSDRDRSFFRQKALSFEVVPELFRNVMAEPCQVLRELSGIAGPGTKR